MARLEIAPFTDAHVPAAARLLAKRHAVHRAAEPLLPEADATDALDAAWRRDGVSGAAATRAGDVVGYLVGGLRENSVWLSHAWVDSAGHAAAEPEIARDLYAAVAEEWVAVGAKLHFVLVPALGDLLEPWYRLGFGQMQIHAIRESGGLAGPLPPGVAIRPGGHDDLDRILAGHATLIWRHQALEPTFTGLVPPPPDELRADWIETLEDPGAALFLAEQDGRIVAHSVLYSADPDLAVPVGAVRLASSATLPEVRGQGIGVALAEHAFAWAREAGYETIVTDWRVTNLLASRFWPARGFRPTFHRLHRVVGIG